MALDTEDNARGKIYLINFYDGDKHYTFRNRGEAIEWLSAQPGHLEIWCTNLGYDLNNLFGPLIERLEIIYIGSRVISARLLNTHVYFRDTLNHWKMSVKEMGIRIGLKKYETKSFNNIKYSRRDTEITYKFTMAMKEEYEKLGCKLKATIGSTALEYYYTHFGERPSEEKILSFEEVEFCRRGYYGGRTEIFFTKPVSGNLWYFDINSLYPASMLNSEYPDLKKRKITKHPNLEREGMMHVEIDAPTNLKIPYLPIRSDKGLIFPVGTFEGFYTYFEIREAQKLGYKIRKVKRALEFSGKVRPFAAFVTTLYKRRLEAQKQKDGLMSDSCKLLMNNLYGKFAQGNVYEKLMPVSQAKGKKDGDTVFGNLVLRKNVGPYQKHANAIWAAYTTAYARHRLYEALIRVENSGGLLLYCDTDSVIFENDQPIIKASTDLGEFKLEGQYRYAHFKLPKLYCLIPKRGSHIYKAKGIPHARGADRRKYQREFFKTSKTKFRKPYKLRECLRRNLNPKRVHKLVPNYWETTKKEMRRVYDKRVVQKSGFTKPIKLAGRVGWSNTPRAS